LFTHQHVGASDVGTASKVKADKGDLACALGSDTTSVARCRYVAGQCRFGLTGVGKQAEHCAAEHRTKTCLEALGDKFAPGDRSPVVVEVQRRIGVKWMSAFSHGYVLRYLVS